MTQQINFLILEDSKVFSELVSSKAKKLGFNVSSCTRGEEALNLAEQQKFAVICVNYYLPDMTAEDFCLEIRALPQLENLHILLITSEKSPELLNKALLSGVTKIFSKNSIAPLEQYLSHYIEDNVY